ncbi:bifunctional oligoribonuclease/PAP phosphatase NrnA [Hoyosella sp. YIM 151337]|nr:bifunctional oligoribonuclease/PAP phosphatase NrnA [Hoyosella sp. YIM 151337]
MTDGQEELEHVAALLRSAESATVLCHVFPDADTLGSGLAVAIALSRWGVPVQVSFAEPLTLPDVFAGLPHSSMIVSPDEVAADTDIVIAVDCGSADRLGALADRLAAARASIVIDHHRSNTRFGTVNYIDPSADSTSMLIARLYDCLGETIDEDVAHCLYAGLVTDTGSFRWCGPAAHLLAARLIGTGINAPVITRDLLDTHPFGRLAMLSAVLGDAQLLPDAAGGQGLVYTTVRVEDMDGLPEDERETVVDIVRTTGEAEVAAVLKQLGPGRWSVSLRSKQSVDVARVAKALGGGGHARSAGFTADDSADAIVAAIVRELG